MMPAVLSSLHSMFSPPATLPIVAMFYPFDRSYMQLALLAGVAVGIAAPLLGAFVVERRMSMMGDGIGHVAFAGVAAGLLLNVWPIWTALIAAVLGAVVLEMLRTSGRASGDLALAVLLYGGIGVGIVIASKAKSLNANLLSYLFGSILTVDRNEALTTVAFAVLIVVAIAIFWRRLLLVVTDASFARTLGINVRFVDYALAIATSLTIVAAMRVVGLWLVASLMVLPVGAARQVARSFRSVLVLGSLFGVCSVVVGLSVARVGALAPGGTIVVTAVALLAALTLANRSR